MKTQFLFLFSFLFIIGMNAQVTNFGTLSGTLGSGSSFFGYGAGNANTTSGTNNTFIGMKTGGGNQTGTNNAFLGAYAGANQTTGSNNTFIGYQSGMNNVSSTANTFVGRGSGFSTTTGRYNVLLGMYSGRFNKTGAGNVLVGYTAGNSQQSAHFNTFVGHQSGYKFLNGGDNTFVGKRSGFSKESGKYNVFVGAGAGELNYSGSGNVFIGNQAGRNETGDEKLYIDNSSTVAPLIYGKFNTDQVGINTTNIPTDYTLAVKGKIIAEEVRVQLCANWPDYVFESNYNLMPISDLKKYIDENKHLPEVPSAQEIEEQGGQDLGEMDRLLLKKVEELSLYVIQLKAEIEELKKK